MMNDTGTYKCGCQWSMVMVVVCGGDGETAKRHDGTSRFCQELDENREGACPLMTSKTCKIHFNLSSIPDVSRRHGHHRLSWKSPARHGDHPDLVTTGLSRERRTFRDHRQPSGRISVRPRYMDKGGHGTRLLTSM